MIQILRTKAEVNEALADFRSSSQAIGLVPTMGALHEGHLALVRKAMSNGDVVVVSIFVNPIQFNNEEDLIKYPNTLDKDLDLLEKEGVRFVFKPENHTLYPNKPTLEINFGQVDQVLEGAKRPGHFNGVGIVVAKLLNIVKPNRTYFGQKDLQQVAVVRSLINDLSFSTSMEVVNTVREKDGLAMSSRNLRLGVEERMVAPLLYQCLNFAKGELLAGKEWFAVKEVVMARFEKEPLARLEYFELVHTDTIALVNDLPSSGKRSICIAAYVGEIRLIDNLIIID
ncbi:pantoate--beta-alanine ligase [Pararhodonellum marinum]|uniref:pantoate--beta-alanine ligase n=1 Tax=Pararhodonellum marinum TaxID=2755358 RepID=UPI00188F6B4E|nr:pantoate--beta-alanine ligase [Pararhodonellum marinum]